jgi:hypothetical protein
MHLFLRHYTAIHSSFRNKNFINPGPFLSQYFGENISIPVSLSEYKIGQTVACVRFWWDVAKPILRLGLEGSSVSAGEGIRLQQEQWSKSIYQYTRRHIPEGIRLQQEQWSKSIYQYTRCHTPEDAHLRQYSHLATRHGHVPHPDIQQLQFHFAQKQTQNLKLHSSFQ